MVQESGAVRRIAACGGHPAGGPMVTGRPPGGPCPWWVVSIVEPPAPGGPAGQVVTHLAGHGVRAHGGAAFGRGRPRP